MELFYTDKREKWHQNKIIKGYGGVDKYYSYNQR